MVHLLYAQQSQCGTCCWRASVLRQHICLNKCNLHSVAVLPMPSMSTFMGTVRLPYFFRSMSVTTQV